VSFIVVCASFASPLSFSNLPVCFSFYRRAKLDDDDDDLEMPQMPQLIPTMAWRIPSLLAERPDVTKAVLNSPELLAQQERVKTVSRALYMSEYDVPSNPAPLSDVEQALDMTSQSAAVVEAIPFFVPAPAPVVAPPLAAPPVSNSIPYSSTFTPGGATPEFVQSLGLPMFLVGQDTQALQTLASSPSLLSTLVDANGMYDQTRLLSLVQTLSASSTGNQVPHQPPSSSYGSQQSQYGAYGPPNGAYGQPPPAQSSFPGAGAGNFGGTSFRSTSSEGNLHVSGFGPTTTQTDIIALFSPYVQVDEVVMKGTFAFVNSSDPPNAQRAREALTGTLLGGMPVRINPATRKKREDNGMAKGAPPFGTPRNHNAPPPSFGSQPPASSSFGGPPAAGLGTPPGVTNVDAVRDDRGNPATKNLFVAGYGPGTTEQQIRETFGEHTHVVGVVLKGTFTFVNTTDRGAAVRCREALSNKMVNGGALRINFAKETGRLGTSFDLTYGTNTGPNAGNARPPPPAAHNHHNNNNNNSNNNSMSYYGRG
jgi:RNA recognition motif-containing protein